MTLTYRISTRMGFDSTLIVTDEACCEINFFKQLLGSVRNNVHDNIGNTLFTTSPPYDKSYHKIVCALLSPNVSNASILDHISHLWSRYKCAHEKSGVDNSDNRLR